MMWSKAMTSGPLGESLEEANSLMKAHLSRKHEMGLRKTKMAKTTVLIQETIEKMQLSLERLWEERYAALFRCSQDRQKYQLYLTSIIEV